MSHSSLRLGSLRSATLLGLLALASPLSPARAQCTTDADCPAGMGCELDTPTSGGGTADCRVGDAGCLEPEPTPAPTPQGQCQPQPIACKDDGDCPTGLTCVEEDQGDSASSCTSSADGGVVCEEPPAPEPATRACGFALVGCQDDSDCTQDGYVCTVTETKADCSDVPCSADGVCPEPAAADCTPSEYRVCFPARVDCSDDSECDDGWTCYALPDDLQKDAPAGYEGATDVCFPEGVALAIDGQIELADTGSRDAGGARDQSAGGKATSDEADADHSAGGGASDAGTGGGKSGGGGCGVAVVSGRGLRAGTLGVLFASVLSLVLRRRAQRAQA